MAEVAVMSRVAGSHRLFVGTLGQFISTRTCGCLVETSFLGGASRPPVAAWRPCASMVSAMWRKLPRSDLVVAAASAVPFPRAVSFSWRYFSVQMFAKPLFAL